MANGVIPDYREEEMEVHKDGDPHTLVKVTVLRCVECGKIRYPGDWPYCPHGDGTKFGEEPLEPYVDEHICANGTDVGVDAAGNKYLGTLITSRGQRAALMREGHLEFRRKRTDLLPSSRVYVDMGRR